MCCINVVFGKCVDAGWADQRLEVRQRNETLMKPEKSVSMC